MNTVSEASGTWIRIPSTSSSVVLLLCAWETAACAEGFARVKFRIAEMIAEVRFSRAYRAEESVAGA